MTRLIVLNGPPGCGKSTLAALYADRHPLVLNLDIDQVRASIGGWRDDPGTAGLLARSIALAAARAHLDAGHDVIIPQLIARPEFLGQLEEVASEAAAEFREIVLLISRDAMLRRFAARGAAGAGIHGDTTEAELTELHERLLTLLPSRPCAIVVPAPDGHVEHAYQELLRALSPAS